MRFEVTRDGEIFVSNLDGNRIVRVTAATGASAIIADFPRDGGWGGLGLSPDGDLYYTTTSTGDGRDILLHLDLSTSEVTEIASGDWLDASYSLDVDSGGRVFVARANGTNSSITRVDPATGATSTVIETTLGTKGS